MLTRNVFWILDRAATAAPDAVAISFEGVDRTNGELHDRALRLAGGLASAGVEPGERVAVLMSNRHEWPEVFFGLAALGAICVPVNVLSSAAELEHVCRDSRSSCLVVDSRGEAVLRELELDLELVVGVDGAAATRGSVNRTYEELLAAEPLVPGEGPDLDDVATLYYSSGTTGLPKAAVHTHGGIFWNSFQQIPDLGLTAEDVYLVVPSLSWAAGFHNLTLAMMWCGGRSVILPSGGITARRIAEVASESGATRAMMVPTLLRQMLADPQALALLRDSSLRWIVSGAEPVPLSVIEQINIELPDCQVVQGYGLSEFPTFVTVLRPDEALTHVGKAGRRCLHVDLAVRLEDGSIGREGHGEVLVRSPATMRGYFERPEETARTFRDGWLNTGDLGTIDAEGYLSITGRTKDLIISGGLNVYPKEIEEVLYRAPGVEEASVVGVEDEQWGETPVAIVVGEADAGELMDLCRQELASYKRPRAIVRRAEPLPRNATGKVLKRELRPWVVEQLQTTGAGQPADR